MITIYHNPRCSKSRQTLELLKQQAIEVNVIEYLKMPLTVKELQTLVTNLGISASQLLRTKEKEYQQAGLTQGSTDAQCIQAIHKFPKLMERPIVTYGNKAAIGRPPEKVLEIL